MTASARVGEGLPAAVAAADVRVLCAMLERAVAEWADWREGGEG